MRVVIGARLDGVSGAARSMVRMRPLICCTAAVTLRMRVAECESAFAIGLTQAFVLQPPVLRAAIVADVLFQRASPQLLRGHRKLDGHRFRSLARRFALRIVLVRPGCVCGQRNEQRQGERRDSMPAQTPREYAGRAGSGVVHRGCASRKSRNRRLADARSEIAGAQRTGFQGLRDMDSRIAWM